MHRPLPQTLIVGLGLALLGAADASAQARVGLLPGDDLASEDRAALESAIADQQGFELVDSLTMQGHVAAAGGLGVTCADASPDCLARIVAVSGLPYALHGTPAVEGDASFMRLLLVDGSGDNLHRRLDLRVRPAGGERAAGLKAGVAHLLTQQALTGAVVLQPAPDDNASVMVDDARIFRSDLERLDVGRRQITVVTQGQRWQAEVDVLAGISTSVKLAPSEEAQAGAPGAGAGTARVDDAGGLPWVSISLVGAAATVAMLGAVAGAAGWGIATLMVPTEESFRDEKNLGPMTPLDAADVAEFNGRVQQGQLVAAGATAVLILGVAAGAALAAGAGGALLLE